jgi:hypothetical protein
MGEAVDSRFGGTLVVKGPYFPEGQFGVLIRIGGSWSNIDSKSLRPRPRLNRVFPGADGKE